VNKLILTLIVLIFLNNCSFNENSKIWKNEEDKIETNKNVKKVFSDENKLVSEFNQGLKLDLSGLNIQNKIEYNLNNFGSQKYLGNFEKIGNYKFSKLEGLNQLNFKPIIFNEGILFFDKKGSVLSYNKKQKLNWKKNHYSKTEKKLQPKLNFLLDNNNVLITDSISSYYSINLDTGELNWLKNNKYPFNSEIKKFKDKIFVVDYKNTLRCYYIKNGTECWNLQTDDSFKISDNKYSLIIINNEVIFTNSIGDITSVNIENGLISWQLPTQSSSIVNETYNFKMSKLVSDGNSIFLSNNKNQFYSIDVKTGIINWINEINSNITPKLVGNLIFTVSNDGFLYVVDKNLGNIIRITDLYKNYKNKIRKKINPVGFVIGGKNLYLTNSDGRILIVGLELGGVIKTEKVSSNLVSEPFIFNNNLYVVRNGSIVQYN